MGLFTPVKKHPNRFNYTPRYYDPVKEAREQRRRELRGERGEDIDEAVAWLNERGIETEPVRFDIYTQNRMTFFKDPDGLPLEIHE